MWDTVAALENIV